MAKYYLLAADNPLLNSAENTLIGTVFDGSRDSSVDVLWVSDICDSVADEQWGLAYNDYGSTVLYLEDTINAPTPGDLNGGILFDLKTMTLWWQHGSACNKVQVVEEGAIVDVDAQLLYDLGYKYVVTSGFGSNRAFSLLPADIADAQNYAISQGINYPVIQLIDNTRFLLPIRKTFEDINQIKVFAPYIEDIGAKYDYNITDSGNAIYAIAKNYADLFYVINLNSYGTSYKELSSDAQLGVDHQLATLLTYRLDADNSYYLTCIPGDESANFGWSNTGADTGFWGYTQYSAAQTTTAKVWYGKYAGWLLGTNGLNPTRSVITVWNHNEASRDIRTVFVDFVLSADEVQSINDNTKSPYIKIQNVQLTKIDESNPIALCFCADDGLFYNIFHTDTRLWYAKEFTSSVTPSWIIVRYGDYAKKTLNLADLSEVPNNLSFVAITR